MECTIGYDVQVGQKKRLLRPRCPSGHAAMGFQYACVVACFGAWVHGEASQRHLFPYEWDFSGSSKPRPLQMRFLTPSSSSPLPAYRKYKVGGGGTAWSTLFALFIRHDSWLQVGSDHHT